MKRLYWDLSIPLFLREGPQPNVHGIPRAYSQPVCEGHSVQEGASCNWESIWIVPHSHGTHTECVGHITKEFISISTCLPPPFLACDLISIESTSAKKTGENYFPSLNENDRVFTAETLKSCSLNAPALVVRSLPYTEEKQSGDYQKFPPPFFTWDAMKDLVERGVEHLLVDVPSVDRADDGGVMCAHRCFWGVELGKKEVKNQSRAHCTITELISVPSELPDGSYGLNLQIPHFETDAVPSRPLLFKEYP